MNNHPPTYTRHIGIVSSTRADWGLLSGIASRLRSNPAVKLSIIATNMHLDPSRGMTVSEIRADGYNPVCVQMPTADDSPVAVAKASAACMAGMAEAFEQLHPDLIVVLGDRFEMLSVASAATVMGIPIAHISGGEITLGAFDDNIRHAISKLSSLHFASTDAHRRRLIAMGESPSTVFNVGALGVDNLAGFKPIDRDTLEASIGFRLPEVSMLVTYHPATNDPVSPEVRVKALLDALDRFPDVGKIITYPNNDPRSAAIIDMITGYAAKHREKVVAIPSLGRERYLSALGYVDCVVGNSSSGIVEVPSAGIPTVDIGIRQKGRTASESVIHCGDDTDSIVDAISRALSSEERAQARRALNPYSKPGTAAEIAHILESCDLAALLPKQFHDINPLT